MAPESPQFPSTIPPERAVVGATVAVGLVALAVVTAGNVAPAAAAAMAAVVLVAALARSAPTFPRGPATWAVVAALAACAVTLLPLPQGLRAVLAPGPARARADLHSLGLQSSWAPTTVDVGGTVREALLWCGAGALLVLLSGPRASLPGLRFALLLLLGLQAAAWADWLAGTHLLPLTYIEDPWDVGQAALRGATHSGWLINRNHWAALGLLLVPWGVAWARTARPAGRVAACALVLASMAGVFASRSRSGMAGLGLQIAAAMVFLGLRVHRRGIGLPLAAVAVVGACLLVVVAPRLRGDVGDDGAGRVTLYPAVARMAAESPLLGWGPGSFRQAFPAFQPESLHYAYSHAHCDPLQVVAEGGVLGLASLALLGAWAVRCLRDGRSSPWARLLWGLSVAGPALVALVEFPLQIPAIRYAWLAVLFAGPALHGDPGPRTGAANRTPEP